MTLNVDLTLWSAMYIFYGLCAIISHQSFPLTSICSSFTSFLFRSSPLVVSVALLSLLSRKSLIVFVDEQCQLINYFMCTFYFIISQRLLSSIFARPKRGVRNQDRAFDCSGWAFLPNWLTYFNPRVVLVIWLKPSNQSRSFKLTRSSTAVNQTPWLLRYLSISLTAYDLI